LPDLKTLKTILPLDYLTFGPAANKSKRHINLVFGLIFDFLLTYFDFLLTYIIIPSPFSAQDMNKKQPSGPESKKEKIRRDLPPASCIKISFMPFEDRSPLNLLREWKAKSLSFPFYFIASTTSFE